MYMRHLSLVYERGGLSALVRQGADCCQIMIVLQNTYQAKGFSDKEVMSAIASAKTAEETAHGRITRIEHEKFEPALDYLLFNLMNNLVVTPTACYIRGHEETTAKLGNKFRLTEEFDGIWRVEGKTDDIVREFRILTN